jgi:hypothetical protein
MNNEPKNAAAIHPSAQSELNRLLEEAMKQPGIAAAMQLAASSEQYFGIVANYENYMSAEQVPTFFSSCSTGAPI